MKKWGGSVEDYLPLHAWFDQSKEILADFRHRSLRHHAEGIFMLETIFGQTITLSSGRVIPTRWIGEQHVLEDLGRTPSFADWARAIAPDPWMGRAQPLHLQFEQANDQPIQQPTPREKPHDHPHRARPPTTRRFPHWRWSALVRGANQADF
jgi:hypothetical protein